MTPPLLTRRDARDWPRRGDVVDPETLAAAATIVADVRNGGGEALLRHVAHFRDAGDGGTTWLPREALVAALDACDPSTRALLQRVAGRIETFARAQLACLTPLSLPIAGGHAGHDIAPVERAGCYAPGGRHPLPSSVLMTAVTARVAGVREVVVASPRPTNATLAAAAIAGADAVLCAGGAHAIAALAYGAGPVRPVDVVVGPGNRFVTAAKQLVAGRVRIDMLAGPSELVVLADASADPDVVAADLLAQAEHDDDAVPVLVTTDPTLPSRVEIALADQLATLPTAATAREALRNGGVVSVTDLDAAIAACDRIAPEHLQLQLSPDAAAHARARLAHYGARFEGRAGAEVLGDYGAGPNHVLPTAGTARHSGGLSVWTFLRVRTWLRVDDPAAARELCEDAAALARIEGLEAHARAAERRTCR